MRVLVHAGLCQPGLSEAAVRHLRKLDWKHAYNPNDFKDDEECICYHGMILKGELGHTKKEEHDNYTTLEYDHGQRHDPLVLQVFDEMGQDMFTEKAEALKNGMPWPPDPDDMYPGLVEAIEIPDDTKYEIYQSEGSWEAIHEAHRIWRPVGGDNPLTQGEQAVINTLRGK